MMVCTVCPHEKRREIDKAIVIGTPSRAIARRYGPSKDAIQRHRSCIAASLERTRDKSGITARGVMLDLVDDLRTMAAESRNGVRAEFLNVADRLTRACDSFGRLNREVESPTVQAFLVHIGSSEGEVREALDLRKSMTSASLGDFKQELLAGMRFLLAEDAEFRGEALSVLEGSSRAEVVEDESEVKGGGESTSHAKDGGLRANGGGHS